jgi:hypothetical protein
MADRYWVGGTGTWATTARWAASSGGAGGQSVPTLNDNVFFDANSNTGTGTFTVTLGASATFRNFSSNTDGRMTIALGNSSYSMNCYGSWFNADSTFFAWSGTTTGALNLLNGGTVPANGGNLNFNGVSLLMRVIFNGIGATWTFQSALIAPATNNITHTNGNIDLNGYTVTVGQYLSTGGTNRQVTFGSARMILSNTIAGTTIVDIGGTGWLCDCSTSGLTGGFQRSSNVTGGTGVSANVGTGFLGAGGFLPVGNAPSFYINSGNSGLNLRNQSVVWELDYTGSNGPMFDNGFLGAYPALYGVAVGANLTLSANTSIVIDTGFSCGFVSNTGIDHYFNTNRGTTPVTMSNFNVTAENGNVIMVGNISMPSTSNFMYHLAGNWILNGYNQNVSSYISTTTASPNVQQIYSRRVDFGSANVYLNKSTANAGGVNIANAVNWNCTGTGVFVKQGSSNEQIFVCGNAVPLDVTVATPPSLYLSSGLNAANNYAIIGYWNDVTLTGNRQFPRASNIYLTGNWTVGNTGNANAANFNNVSIEFVGTKTQSVTGTANRSFNTMAVTKSPGNASNSITLLESATVVGNVLLSEGTLNLGNNTLTVPDAFNSKSFLNRSIIFGTGNIALTGTTAFDIVLDAYVSGLTCTGTGGFTRNMSVISVLSLDGGVPPSSGNNLPNMTFTGTELIILKDPLQPNSNFYANNITFSGTSIAVGSPNAGGDNVNMYISRNTTLNSGGTYANVALKQIGTGTLTTNGKSLQSYSVQCGTGVSGTATLGGALTTTGNIELIGGTFTTANYSVTTPYFNVPGAQVAVLNMGTSTFTISGNSTQAWRVIDSASNVTINRGTSTISMTSGNSKTFTGGSKTYYNLNQGAGGTLTIAGNNTFANITNSVQPTTVTFTAGTTQTVTNFGLSGAIGSPVTINSSSPGTQATLSKSSGVVDAQYLAIADSNATGGATWNAYFSLDNGNNTGWNIYSGSAIASDFFLMFD